ncbi:hypothetical protein V8F06_011106 [Rhypophila decipiens]
MPRRGIIKARAVRKVWGSPYCDREVIKVAISRYLIAQSTGQLGWLSSFLSSGSPSNNTTTIYTENLISQSITSPNITLSTPIKIDYSRTAIDTIQCASYTEILSISPSSPYQIATQLFLDPSTHKITRLNSIVTTTGDLYFNASHALHYALLESPWTPLPPHLTTPREDLLAAANSYFDIFLNKSIHVPFGSPCTRVVGGYLDSVNGDCNTDIPDVAVGTVNRTYVVDEERGIVDVIAHFGILGPDSHQFRIEKGEIKEIHSMTVCPRLGGGLGFNCGALMTTALGEDVGW